MIGRVDRASLESAGISLYDKIAELVKPGLKFALGDGFQFGAAIEANFEAYWHSDTGFDRESDWVYGFVRRKPMAKFPLDFSLDDFFYAYCDTLALMVGWSSTYRQSFLTNILAIGSSSSSK